MPTHPLPQAMLAADLDAVVDAFTPDAVLHSPITGSFRFEGRDQLRTLFRAILEVFSDIRYSDEVRQGDKLFLVSTARVGDQVVQGCDVARLAEDGRIREFTAFFRPLVAITESGRRLGPALVRPRSRARARIAAVLSTPLVTFTRAGDRIAGRLVADEVTPVTRSSR